jgi:hypothetical protein
MFAFLARKLGHAPQRGRGVYLRRFIENFQQLANRYAKGLFHCYDDPRIPNTSNLLEGLNGTAKQNLRRCAGRTCTAHGPGSSCGSFYMLGVALHAVLPPDEIQQLIQSYDPELFRSAKKTLEQTRQPAHKRRSMLRNPEKHLAQILANWKDPP